MRKMLLLFLIALPLPLAGCTGGLGDSLVPAGDGQGFTGIITFENARTRCETTNLGARLQRVACRVDDGTGVPTSKVAAGVSFNWALTSSSGVDLVPISTCTTSADTLSYTCDVDSSSLVAAISFEVLLAVLGPESQAKTVSEPVSVAAPASGDSFYSSVTALLSMIGLGSNDPIVDVKGRHSVINYGAEITDTPSKFGTGAAYFSGTSFTSWWGGDDYMEIPSSTDFNLGSGDFTIELYVYFRVLGTYNRLVSRWDNPLRNFMICQENGRWHFYYSLDGSSNLSISYMHTPATGQWYHVAVSRSGGTLRLFLDGVLVANGSIAGSIASSTQKVLIGKINNSESPQFIGSMSHLRFSSVARYTANFTPPSGTDF